MGLSGYIDSFAHLPIQVPIRSSKLSGTSSVHNYQHTLKALGNPRRLQVKASAGDGDVLQSEISTPSTIASPPTQPDSSVHEDGPTLNHEPADITNDGSEDLLNLSQPVLIRKYVTFEDESFFGEVHIKSFNT